MDCGEGGEIVHGEFFIDGDGSGANEVILYKQGSTAVRTLADTEFLYISDIVVTCETGGDVSVYFDTDAAGKRVLKMAVAAKSGYDHQYETPLCGPKGAKLYFVGAGTNVNYIAIEGFIRSA